MSTVPLSVSGTILARDEYALPYHEVSAPATEECVSWVRDQRAAAYLVDDSHALASVLLTFADGSTLEVST